MLPALAERTGETPILSRVLLQNLIKAVLVHLEFGTAAHLLETILHGILLGADLAEAIFVM